MNFIIKLLNAGGVYTEDWSKFNVSRLTAVRIRVELMTISQDALIAGHADRDFVGVSGTPALDFPRHGYGVTGSGFRIDPMEH